MSWDDFVEKRDFYNSLKIACKELEEEYKKEYKKICWIDGSRELQIVVPTYERWSYCHPKLSFTLKIYFTGHYLFTLNDYYKCINTNVANNLKPTYLSDDVLVLATSFSCLQKYIKNNFYKDYKRIAQNADVKKWINILKEKKTTEFYIPSYYTSGIYSKANLNSCIVSFDGYSHEINAYALIVYIIENMNNSYEYVFSDIPIWRGLDMDDTNIDGIHCHYAEFKQERHKEIKKRL